MLESLLIRCSPKGEQEVKTFGLKSELANSSAKLALPCLFPGNSIPPSRSSLEFSLLLQAVKDVTGKGLGTSVPCEPHLPVTPHGAFLTPDVLQVPPGISSGSESISFLYRLGL